MALEEPAEGDGQDGHVLLAVLGPLAAVPKLHVCVVSQIMAFL